MDVVEKLSEKLSKLNLGQFYTTNVDYIFQDFKLPEGKIIEPFAGQGDILHWIKRNGKCEIEAYDLDPKDKNIVQRDTLLDPPEYKGKYVYSNPPFRARNKISDKKLFDKYNTNDLFRCFLISILDCSGGILIATNSIFHSG